MIPRMVSAWLESAVMSSELIGILGVGVALAGLLLTGFRGIENRLGARIDSLEGRVDSLDARLAVVERGQAKLEGLLEGIRDAVFERRRSAKS